VDGGEREFEAEVEDARRLAGKTLRVYVNGAAIGTMQVSRLGAAELRRNSDEGDAVPAIAAGSTVEVKQRPADGGKLVVSGRF
jgi:hypothetical protein